MKLKRLSAVGSAFVLSIASLLTIAFPGIAHAAAPYTCTWTGGGGNSNFNTAGNWSGCNSAAPQPGDGDNLIFDNTNLSANASPVNNISGLTVGTITFQGTNSNYYYFDITGNAITVNSGITDNGGSGQDDLDVNITLGGNVTVNATSNGIGLGIGDSSTTLTTAGHTLTFSGSQSTCYEDLINAALAGSGNIVDNSAGALDLFTNSSSYTGAISVNDGVVGLMSSGVFGSTTGVTVANGATLDLNMGIAAQNTTYNFPLTLAGGTLAADSGGQPGGCAGGGGTPPTYTATLSGALTLTANSQYYGGEYSGAINNVTVTGTYTSNGFTLTSATGSQGTLTLPNGSQVTPPAQTVNYTADSPSTQITVSENETAVVTGTYGETTVESGGILKGTGSVAGLQVQTGGTVSPGDAPGCITINGDYNQGGTYQAEIGGTTACSGYDQLVVTGSGNTVELDDVVPPTQGTLDVSLINGFKPSAGQTFEIINNQTGSAVTNTFANLPEGSTITVSGYVFKITYKGGTSGNSVVLTVVSVPATPNTGFGLASTKVGLPIVGGLMMASGFYFVSRKVNKPATKRR